MRRSNFSFVNNNSGGGGFNGGDFNIRRMINLIRLRYGDFGLVAIAVLLLILLVWLLNAVGVEVILGRIIGLLLGFTLHEWAHAYMAHRLGGWRALPDPSRLTLKPQSHIAPLGVALALIAGFGWARPVPVNPAAFYPNERRDMLSVAFAGPFANLIIALVFGILVRILVAIDFFTIGSVTVFLGNILLTIVSFNILLCLFNLIPLAPLDGWKILIGLLPADQANEVAKYEQESTMLLFLLILFGFVGVSVIAILLEPAQSGLFNLFTGLGF